MTRASAGGPPVEAASASTLGASGTRRAAETGATAVRPAHSEPIGRRRMTGTAAMMRSCVQISVATAS